MEKLLELRLRNTQVNEFGAAGLYVKDQRNKRFILSCSHVIMGTTDNLSGWVPSNASKRWVYVLKRGQKVESGQIAYAMMDTDTDVGLISVNGAYANAFPNGILLRQPITSNQVQPGDPVYFYSTQGMKRCGGKLESHGKTEQLKHGGDRVITFNNVIRFGNPAGDTWKTISKKGDSGSVVFNQNNEPFAMLIGGNETFSFAIPLEPILSNLQLKAV